MHWLQLQSTPCEALPSVWIGFAWQYSQACSHPCCLCTFSYPNSSFQSTLHLICFDTALCNQPHLSVMTFCDLPSLRSVNVRLLDHCKSAVFSIIVVSRTRDTRNLYCRMVIYWNSNVNILIFWDTDFLTFMSCKLYSSKLNKKTFEMFYFTWFHFLNNLQEKMNFHDILIYWDAPVFLKGFWTIFSCSVLKTCWRWSGGPH